MTEQEACKIADQIIKICKQNYPDVWFKPYYDHKPDLKFINLEISIMVAPKYTRKMELKR